MTIRQLLDDLCVNPAGWEVLVEKGLVAKYTAAMTDEEKIKATREWGVEAWRNFVSRAYATDNRVFAPAGWLFEAR